MLIVKRLLLIGLGYFGEAEVNQLDIEVFVNHYIV